MGFGSYDESEQENQKVDTDVDGGEQLSEQANHDGEVEFEFNGTPTDELIAKLHSTEAES